MQAARLLEPELFRIGPRRTLGTKILQSARALQLEWRYSKREVLGDLPDPGADGRQPRGRARRLLRLFRQGAQAPQRRRSGAAGRHPAIARAPPARPLARRRPGRARARAGARPAARGDRRLAARPGVEPAGAQPAARHAAARAAPLGLARRPVAGRRRADDHPLRASVGPAAIGARGARPHRRPAGHRHRGGRQPHGHRRRLAGRLRLFRPRRPGRPGARPSLARLGAEAVDLRHGVRRSHPASRIADRGRAGALPRLAAAQLRPRPPGRRHRAPRAAAVAERARRADAGEGRAAALPVDPAHRGRRARPAAGRHRCVAGHCARQRHGLAARDGRALCRPGARRRVRAARRSAATAPAASRCA